METTNNPDIFSDAAQAIKDKIAEIRAKRGLHYPYDEEELKNWKDNKLKAEIVKMRIHINRGNASDDITNEFAKLQKEADRRGLFLSATEKKTQEE